ncbi:ATP-binding cassette domain-containing protein [Paraburkholderia domus]|uniref:ATP-binding cassette domain-containing protein n=1 Tax=Paraburkholderia domus TaxID=2793075 RepID=UPI001EF00866
MPNQTLSISLANITSDPAHQPPLAEIHPRIMLRTVHLVTSANGAGKAALFHVLTDTLPSSEGKIIFDSRDLTHEPDHNRVRRGVVRSFQVTTLLANLSARKKLAATSCCRQC